MDNNTTTMTESRRSVPSVNGSVRRPITTISSNAIGSMLMANRPNSLQHDNSSDTTTTTNISSTAASPSSSPSNQQQHSQIKRVVVVKDDKGYGMKVSGDNPVFVQSVKPGGPAEKAGLNAGDRIMEVNSVNVITSTHTDVVALIKASPHVVLTVQQQRNNKMGRITGPQPVDHEKQHQLQLAREQQYRLMLEKEQCHVDALRSQLAQMPDEKKYLELEKSERNVQKLQGLLQNLVRDRSQQQSQPSNNHNVTVPLANLDSPSSSSSYHSPSSPASPSLPFTQRQQQQSPAAPAPPPKSRTKNDDCANNDDDVAAAASSTSSSPPPPLLPKRPSKNKSNNNSGSPSSTAARRGVDCSIGDRRWSADKCQSLGRRAMATKRSMLMIDNCLYSDVASNVATAGVGASSPLSSSPIPPPLPPRCPNPLTNNNHTIVPNPSDSNNQINNGLIGIRSDNNTEAAANSISKQMSYPLVATCATLVNNYSPNNRTHNHHHHRTKSSPETLMTNLSAAEASKRLIASESMNDLRFNNNNNNSYDSGGVTTPPGTPPPPYPSPSMPKRRNTFGSSSGGHAHHRNSSNTDEGDSAYDEIQHPDHASSPEVHGSSNRHNLSRILANASPIHAANPQMAQQSIMSMEDDEISDQEISQLEDHGPFKSISKLWDYTPHLAVFTNYILSNSDPNSLLFYLLTDLYKEGNAKEMRKWAFEIHSCFLVPGAPLRLSNVDENVAREIDDVLTKEYDKEEILRKIFWKARTRAKEELTKQLVDFQQKRTAGLGTIFGPSDCKLNEIYLDKSKEAKLYESIFADKLDPYLEELEKENYDARKFLTGAALTTVATRIFSLRHGLDRFPTFVNKDKSFRTKFIGKYHRKLTVHGHHFTAQQFYTVIHCNNCHQIIYGISPQGYQCTVCQINLHRTCVKKYDDTCPGPIIKKDRGIQKFLMDKIRHEPSRDHRRKTPSNFVQMERERRQAEEREPGFDAAEQVANYLERYPPKALSECAKDVDDYRSVAVLPFYHEGTQFANVALLQRQFNCKIAV